MQSLANKTNSDYYFANGSKGLDISTGDPYWDNVSLLLSMNGTNGSTTFTDSSKNNISMTASGAVISTTQSKFGGSSGAFISAGTNRLYSGSNSVFGMGTGDFTAEMWVYKSTSITNFNGIFNLNQYNTGILLRMQTTSDSFYINGTNYNWNPSTNFPLNQWNHLAIVRNGNVFDIYVNGNSVLSVTNSSDLGATGTVEFGNQSHDANHYLNGYIDEARITKGIARYTSNFIPPTEPFLTYR